MTIAVNIELDREFTVAADIDTAFALLANVPESASHFPKLEQLDDLGDNSFRWNMERLEIGGKVLQTVYASHYAADEAAKTITWAPVKGEGNATVAGTWTLAEDGAGTKLMFETTAELTLPLPKLVKVAVSPVVKQQFASLLDTYIANLKATLS